MDPANKSSAPLRDTFSHLRDVVLEDPQATEMDQGPPRDGILASEPSDAKPLLRPPFSLSVFLLLFLSQK